MVETKDNNNVDSWGKTILDWYSLIIERKE